MIALWQSSHDHFYFFQQQKKNPKWREEKNIYIQFYFCAYFSHSLLHRERSGVVKLRPRDSSRHSREKSKNEMLGSVSVCEPTTTRLVFFGVSTFFSLSCSLKNFSLERARASPHSQHERNSHISSLGSLSSLLLLCSTSLLLLLLLFFAHTNNPPLDVVSKWRKIVLLNLFFFYFTVCRE